MKNNTLATHSDFAMTQHVERRRAAPPPPGLKRVDAQQTRLNRTPAQRPEYRRAPVQPQTAAAGRASKISPQFAAAALVIMAVAAFAYYALLYQSETREPLPVADSRAFIEMFNYASGVTGDMESAAFEAMPLNTSESFSWQNYTVRRGDSVSKIAAAYSLSMDAIIASNDLKNARNLRAGDILRIPNMDGIPYTVTKGDSYQKIAGAFSVPVEAILDANDIQDEKITAGSVLFIPGAKMKSEDLKLAMGEFFIYPVSGRLSSTYGWRKDPFTGERRFHAAIDLAANTGAPVKAAMDGTVRSTGFNAVFGRYLIITHAAGYQTMYAHLNTTAVKEGDKIRQGDTIAEVGSTGRSTGPHLHFAVYKNGRAINPLEHLKL